MGKYVHFDDEDFVHVPWDKETIINQVLAGSPTMCPRWTIRKDLCFGYDLIAITNKHVSEEVVWGSNQFSERQAKLVGKMYHIVVGIYITQDEGYVENPIPHFKTFVADCAERVYKKLDMET